MRILVLGGTAWLGGEVAKAALARGDEVTCLARGRSGPVPDGARLVAADRDEPGAYDAVTGGEHWDVVVDVARQPGQVRSAVAALEPHAARYVFVSTGNVYADHATPGQDESAPLLPPLEGDVMTSMEVYGEGKVACERAVVEAFGPDRSLLARAGLIAGPGDTSGRTGYWPRRFARPAASDGAVLVPEAPLPTQVVDVRDLAAWLLGTDARGALNAMGPTVPLAEHLATARAVAGHEGPVVAAPSGWLTEQGVAAWGGPRSLPLWLDDPDWEGFLTHDSSRARAAGLTYRPLEETLRDTLAWELASTGPWPHGAGLTDDDEREVLARLRTTTRTTTTGTTPAPS